MGCQPITNRPDLSAIARWPNVPACYGWLSLDQRGRWRLRGETLTHQGLHDFLNRHYVHDDDGNYFVQNGPQRVYVALDYTPWVLHLDGSGLLSTHTGRAVTEIRAAAFDEEGNFLLEASCGIALLCDRDLPGLLDRIHRSDGVPIDDEALLTAIKPPFTDKAALTFHWQDRFLPLGLVRRADVARRYGFIASPRAAAPGDVA